MPSGAMFDDNIIHCLEQKPLKRRVKKRWLNYEASKNMQTIYDLLLLAPNMAISFAWKKQSTEIHRKACLKKINWVGRYVMCFE